MVKYNNKFMNQAKIEKSSVARSSLSRSESSVHILSILYVMTIRKILNYRSPFKFDRSRRDRKLTGEGRRAVRSSFAVLYNNMQVELGCAGEKLRFVKQFLK